MEKEKAIQELIELDRFFEKKFREEGPSAWTSPYGKDATVVTYKNHPNITGIEDIKKFSNEYIHAVTFNDTYDMSVETLFADVSEDFTLGYTTGNLIWKNKIDGKIINSLGKYVLVWKKYDGEWKVRLNFTK